jgi:diamine N-acetyltransferase
LTDGAAMQLVAAGPGHVPSIMEIEAQPDCRPFVGRWPAALPCDALANPDCRYLLIDDGQAQASGFVILRGLAAGTGGIELKRIAVAAPGRGLGRRAMGAVMARVFGEDGAHRLWLDVFDFNARARQLYRSLGFREDGILREAVARDGRYKPLILLSILDREYAAYGRD